MPMRAKFYITQIVPFGTSGNGETLHMSAVTEKPFDDNGISEDNAFAAWTPSGTLVISVTNPALIGKYTVGDRYYLDFSLATP
jgi:hypothetical protein